MLKPLGTIIAEETYKIIKSVTKVMLFFVFLALIARAYSFLDEAGIPLVWNIALLATSGALLAICLPTGYLAKLLNGILMNVVHLLLLVAVIAIMVYIYRIDREMGTTNKESLITLGVACLFLLNSLPTRHTVTALLVRLLFATTILGITWLIVTSLLWMGVILEDKAIKAMIMMFLVALVFPYRVNPRYWKKLFLSLTKAESINKFFNWVSRQFVRRS